jgi:hypothetical protein
MLCVQPLYFNEHRYRGLTGHKYNFFVLCMSIILVAVVLILLAKIIGGNKLLSLKDISVADWAILGFAGVTLISALFSPYRDIVDVWNGLPERHDGVITQLFYVLIFLIIAHWYKPRERDFGFFCISAICIGLIGVLQFHGWDIFKLWPNEEGSEYFVENFYNIWFRSTLGNINMLATYVCVAVLLCGFLYVKTEASRWRYVWLAGSASCFWLMMIGGSESGMVGVLVTVILAIPFIIGSLRYLGRFLILGASWLGVYTLQKLLYDVRILEAEFAVGVFFAVTAVLLAGGLMLTLFKKKSADNLEKPVKWKLGTVLMVVVVVVGIVSVEIFGRHNNLDGFYAKDGASAEVKREESLNWQYSMFVTGGAGVEMRVEMMLEADTHYDFYAPVMLKSPQSAELTIVLQTGLNDKRIVNTMTINDEELAWIGVGHVFSESELASGFATVGFESNDENIEFYVGYFHIPDIFYTGFYNTPWRPVYQAREMLYGRTETEFGSHRIYIWQNALEAFPSDNPIIGSGPDTFWQAFPNRAEVLELHGVRYDKAHNEYLQILICQGILGLLCFLVFLGYLLVRAVPKAFKNPMLMAVLAGFMGYCVQAFFNISLPIASQMLWVMAGVMACYLRVDKMEKM